MLNYFPPRFIPSPIHTFSTALFPNKQPRPRGESRYSDTVSSGSLHTRSHTAPNLGISSTRESARMSSKLLISLDIPPCTHIMLSFTICIHFEYSLTWHRDRRLVAAELRHTRRMDRKDTHAHIGARTQQYRAPHTATRGRRSNTSIRACQGRVLAYFCAHSSYSPYSSVIALLS